MPQATLEEEKAVGLVGPPPGVPDIEPETHVIKLAKVDARTYRRLMSLSPDQKAEIKKVMKEVVQEWRQNTRLQNNKLYRSIDRLEGVSSPKDFPWPNSSNLNIPYTEIQILVAWDIVSSTLIDADPAFFLRELLPARKDYPEEHVDPKLEAWWNFVFKRQINLADESRMAIYLAFRDPLSLLVLDWVEEIPVEYRIQVFDKPEDLLKQFKDAQAAGVPTDTFDSWLGQLGVMHEPIALEIRERVVRYRGPKARVVELKDFVRVPVSTKNLESTLFHGDQFRERRGWFKSNMNREWFYKDECQRLIDATARNSAIDDISRELDTIEGLTSNRRTPDEYDCVRGNLKYDLLQTGEEQLYHVVYNEEHNCLLRVEKYPYWHNRTNYIPFRIRRKPNRLLGRCFVDMLYDINEEINTQHNQRIDSRTITTVPSFKINASETDLMAMMERKEGHFYPGCKFVVSNMNNFAQLETKVDFLGTLQEEQNLFGIGDMLTGTAASAARSGAAQETASNVE